MHVAKSFRAFFFFFLVVIATDKAYLTKEPPLEKMKSVVTDVNQLCLEFV